MLRLASFLFALLSFSLLTADFAEASSQRRRRRRARPPVWGTTSPEPPGRGTVNSSRFSGANPCARIQAAIDSLAGRGGTVVADEAGDCGDSTQVRVRGGVTLRLPPGTFTYSMRGYGGPRNMVGALFLLDSDTTLEGSGPDTVIKESSWVHTTQSPAEQRRSVANGEHQATFKVILTYANAVANGSTARNITVRNLKLAGGKPELPGSFNSAGGALDLANCHDCLVENVHMERTRSIGIHIGGHATSGQDPGADLAERGVRQPLGRYAENVTVRNCVFIGVASQNLALVNGRRITFENNRFLAPGLRGGPGSTPIDVEPNHHLDYMEHVVIRNNYIDARETDKANNGIVVQSTSLTDRVGPILIENNEIIGGNNVPPRITNKIANGIYVFGQTMKDVTIRDNRVTRTGQAGIRLEGTRFTVTNNRLTDVGGGGNPGFFMARVVDSLIEGNTFTYTGKGPADSRMLMTAGTRNNVFRNNRGFEPPSERKR